MVDEEYREEEQAVGGGWRSFFEDDPEELFDYTDRAYEEYQEVLDHVIGMSEAQAKVRTWAAMQTPSIACTLTQCTEREVLRGLLQTICDEEAKQGSNEAAGSCQLLRLSRCSALIALFCIPGAGNGATGLHPALCRCE